VLDGISNIEQGISNDEVLWPESLNWECSMPFLGEPLGYWAFLVGYSDFTRSTAELAVVRIFQAHHNFNSIR
jgi:hypothetical protein